jgi:SAM-dependent methyltransferase
MLRDDVVVAEDIKVLFKKRHGVDIERFFLQPQAFLREVEPHGYFKFEGVLPGDDQFYAELMGRRGYDEGNKAEFRKANEFIGPTSRVLDIGCGPGRFSRYCSGEYKGIELNPFAVREAQSLGVNVQLERLEDQEPDRYDVVTLFQVLEHVADPEAFLSGAAKCVAPGGRLIVSTPDLNGPMGFAVNQELNYPPHHLTWWSAEALSSLVQSMGFEVASIWREPLQRCHISMMLFSLIYPRKDKHVDLSLKAKACKAVSALIGRFIARHYEEIPFIRGHTVMVVARKK